MDNSREADSRDYLLENTHFITLNDSWKATVGALVWWRNAKGDEPAFLPNDNTTDIYTVNGSANSTPFNFLPYHEELFLSTYGQLDYKATDALKFTAGAQVNKAPDQPVSAVPRFSTVYQVDPNWNLKLLYGEAYRSPSLSERYRVSTSATGSVGLKPETTQTLEAQVAYRNNNLQSKFAVYKAYQNNLISRSNPVAPDPRSYYYNISVSEAHGVEIEGKYRMASYDFLLGQTLLWTSIENTYDPFKQPTFLTKGGISRRLTETTLLGLFDEFVGATGVTSAYNWLTFNTHVNLGHSVFLDLYLINLLNQTVDFSEYIRQKIPSIPGAPGRSGYVSLSYSF